MHVLIVQMETIAPCIHKHPPTHPYTTCDDQLSMLTSSMRLNLSRNLNPEVTVPSTQTGCSMLSGSPVQTHHLVRVIHLNVCEAGTPQTPCTLHSVCVLLHAQCLDLAPSAPLHTEFAERSACLNARRLSSQECLTQVYQKSNTSHRS